MKIVDSFHLFNKFRRHRGVRDAWQIYKSLHVTKTGRIKLPAFKHEYAVRIGNTADSATHNEVILRGGYDIPMAFEPKTILDCGANIGLASIVFANRFPNATIVAVEPEEENFRLLESNARPYQNIHCVKSAIWSKRTHLLIENEDALSNCFRVVESEHKTPKSFESLGIKDLMDMHKWSRIDLLKMDVEGAEKELFTNNFQAWLPLTRLLVVETHDRFVKGTSKALFSALINYNFSCRLMGFNFVLKNEDLA